MAARIYQIQKNALQSGKARTDKWVLEFAPNEAKKPDPLTGWAGSGDTQSQVKLTFPSVDAARAYADKYGIDYRLITTPLTPLALHFYAHNFRRARKWRHNRARCCPIAALFPCQEAELGGKSHPFMGKL